MTAPQDQTVRPDSKGRIALGAHAKGVSSYRIHAEKDGRLVLEPYKEIPAREMWLHENKEALGKVQKGLQDAKEGKVTRRGDFTKFIED
jgi:predicted RNA-binding protein YlxR (DUF448 family)